MSFEGGGAFFFFYFRGVISSSTKSDGLALWWKEDVNIAILSASKNFIDASFTVNDGLQWFCTFIYGCPKSKGKREVRNTISNLRNGDEEPWCLMGDSNVIISKDEKIGGNPFVARYDDPFQTLMDDHGLLEMPLKGGPFTWSNKRSDEASILEKIDRTLFKIQWNSLFSKAIGLIKPAMGSDHSPLILLLKGAKAHCME
ncbi:hypothetical protein V6N13_037753 [Hibiscus sabdariffa]